MISLNSHESKQQIYNYLLPLPSYHPSPTPDKDTETEVTKSPNVPQLQSNVAGAQGLSCVLLKPPFHEPASLSCLLLHPHICDLAHATLTCHHHHHHYFISKSCLFLS